MNQRFLVGLLVVPLLTTVFGYIHENSDDGRSRSEFPPPEGEDPKQALHKTVQKLLDYKHVPRDEGLFHRNSFDNPAAEYMKKLFEEYNNQDFEGDENVVRSILPKIGILNGQEALSFNLESVKPGEKIIRAELHFNQRHKMRPDRLKPFKKGFVVSAACASCPVTSTPNGKKRVTTLMAEPVSRSMNSHWLIWDLQDFAEDAIQKNLPLTIQVFRNERFLPPTGVLRRHSPFLLVYSSAGEQSQSTSTETYSDSTVMDSLQASLEHDELTSNRVKRSIAMPQNSTEFPAYYYSYNHAGQPENKEVKLLENSTPMYRSREQILQKQMEEFARSGPKALSSRKQHHRRRKHRRFKSRSNDVMKGFGVDEERSRRKNKQSTDNDLKVLLLGKQGRRGEKNQPCARHKFSVSFRDIGWHDVVIQPDSFDAYYCAGSCDFPLNLEANPSNHALIQSLANTMNIYHNVPKVCCAPDKMDSLTMLFFDETGNVVLKNFPRMVVSSCSCL